MDILDKIDNKTIKVLDHGYVQLVDVMPRVLEEDETCDIAICDAARVSYQAGTERKSTDQGLINYLMRHRHTSPFEMVEFKFECRMPIFVARQWVRHRTASLNEESARYSKLRGDFYLPKPGTLRQQSDNNKQATESNGFFDPALYAGSGHDGSDWSVHQATDHLHKNANEAYDLYKELLDQDVAREQARMVLGTNIYTSWVWKMDLHNLLHFLRLRLDPHAQYEIRVYAEAIAEFVKQLCPWTWEAFEKYQLNACSFSGPELKLISQLLKEHNYIEELINSPDPHPEQLAASDISKGEWREFLVKLGTL